MNEPPDPGGFVPPAGCFITVESESGMETDRSQQSQTSRPAKRSKRSLCKDCNKRRRKHGQGLDDHTVCNCEQNSQVTLVANNHEVPSTKITQSSNANTTAPSFLAASTGRTRYVESDCAPYVVHVQKIPTSNDERPTLHPLAFGKFLKKGNFKNIINGSVKRLGRNKISLSFSTVPDVNSFLTNSSLLTQNLKAFIPTFNITRMGLVRGVPAEWSPEEVMENITVPIGCGPIVKIRRLNYKTFIDNTPTWKPSQTIVITFDGQVLPKRIFICYNSLPVDLYIYPTVQCYSCCRFGHTKNVCKSKPRCFKCGREHTGDSCSVSSDEASCCLCTGYHYANSQTCPEYARQKNIKLYMAQNCVSYSEAAKLHPPVSKSFVDTFVTPENTFSHNNNKLYNKPNLPSSSSYKKTVFLKPRSPTKPVYGYDKAAHNALINDNAIPQPKNGCALENKEKQTIDQVLPSDFITALFELLSQFNLTPSNAAPLVNKISHNIIHNGQSNHNNSMELSQS